MTNPDSDLRFHPQEEVDGQKPEWIDVVKQLSGFPEGSIGFAFGTDIGIRALLEGRKRSQMIFQRPLTWLYSGRTNQDIQSLEEVGLTLVSDVLTLSPDDLTDVTRSPEKAADIRNRIKGDLEGFVAGLPHARLLRAIYRYHTDSKDRDWSIAPIIVPLTYEEQIIQVVEEYLTLMRENINVRTRNIGKEILRQHYGLDNGVPVPYTELGETYSTGSANIKRYADNVTRKLSGSTAGVIYEEKAKVREQGKILRSFLPLPLLSFGTLAFGAHTHKDLPDVFQESPWDKHPVKEDPLLEDVLNSISSQTRSEIMEHYPDISRVGLYGLLFLDLSSSPLSQGSLGDVVEVLRNKLVEEQTNLMLLKINSDWNEQERQMVESSIITIDEEELENQRRLGNNLFPELRLTEDTINQIKDIYVGNILPRTGSPISFSNKLQQIGIQTVGDLLNMSRENFIKSLISSYSPRLRSDSTIHDLEDSFRTIAAFFPLLLVSKTIVDQELGNNAEFVELSFLMRLAMRIIPGIAEDILGIDISIIRGYEEGQKDQYELYANIIDKLLKDTFSKHKGEIEDSGQPTENKERRTKRMQDLLERRQAQDQKEMAQLSDIMTEAMQSGAKTPQAIHNWIIENKQSPIINVSKTSWKLLAMISYVLNRPGEEKKNN